MRPPFILSSWMLATPYKLSSMFWLINNNGGSKQTYQYRRGGQTHQLGRADFLRQQRSRNGEQNA